MKLINRISFFITMATFSIIAIIAIWYKEACETPLKIFYTSGVVWLVSLLFITEKKK